MARKYKLSNKVIEEICAAISIGADYKMAYTYARVSEGAFYLWKRVGEAEKERLDNDPEAKPSGDRYTKLCLKLLQSIEEAQADAGIGWLNVIDNAATVDPAWAKYMLEQKFPDSFAPPKQRNQTQTLNIDVTKMTDEQLERVSKGEDPYFVIATSSGYGDRAEAATDEIPPEDQSAPEISE